MVGTARTRKVYRTVSCANAILRHRQVVHVTVYVKLVPNIGVSVLVEDIPSENGLSV